MMGHVSLPTGRHAVQTALGTSPVDALNYLRLEPQPAPEPEDDEILIEVKAATVGWVDLLMSSGQYQHVPEPPYTPGLEFAGVVAAAGPDVAEVSTGDAIIADGLYTGPRSLGAHRRFGGFARWALAPAICTLRCATSGRAATWATSSFTPPTVADETLPDDPQAHDRPPARPCSR